MVVSVPVVAVSPFSPEIVPLLLSCAALSVSVSSLMSAPLLSSLPEAVTMALPFAPVSPFRIALRALISSVVLLVALDGAGIAECAGIYRGIRSGGQRAVAGQTAGVNGKRCPGNRAAVQRGVTGGSE